MNKKVEQLNNLVNINRFSGTHLIKSESVSDHVWGMISLAITHIPSINAQRNKEGLALIDLKDLIFKICLHDLDEAFYTDIPRPFKHHDKNILDAINHTALELMREVGLDEVLINQIITAKDGLTGFYVEVFDLIQCGLKMIHEIKLGNSYMYSEILNVIEALTYLRDSLKDHREVDINFINQYIQEFSKYEE